MNKLCIRFIREKEMKQRFKSENELRTYNLKQYISDVHNDCFKSFNEQFKKYLRERLKFNHEQIETKSSQVRQAYKGHRNFTAKQQELVEKAFDLPKGILTKIRPARKPAYIFVSCQGKTCDLLYRRLKKHELVDEVSILFGDIDLFIRIYGSIDEIQEFITTDLYSDSRITINSTRTYFSLHNKNWSKYPIQKHPGYQAPKDRWLKSSEKCADLVQIYQ